jgi:hypothetical protein
VGGFGFFSAPELRPWIELSDSASEYLGIAERNYRSGKILSLTGAAAVGLALGAAISNRSGSVAGLGVGLAVSSRHSASETTEGIIETLIGGGVGAFLGWQIGRSAGR